MVLTNWQSVSGQRSYVSSTQSVAAVPRHSPPQKRALQSDLIWHAQKAVWPSPQGSDPIRFRPIAQQPATSWARVMLISQVVEDLSLLVDSAVASHVLAGM